MVLVFIADNLAHETNPSLILLCSAALSMLSSQKLKTEGTQQQPVPGSRAAENSKAQICFSKLLKALAEQNLRRASWAGHPLALFISSETISQENMFPFYIRVSGKPHIHRFPFLTCPCKQILAADNSGCSGSLWGDYNDSRNENCDNSPFPQLIWSSKR